MSAPSSVSTLEKLGSRFAQAVGLAAGTAGMLVGENAAYVAQCAEVTCVKAQNKISNAIDTARAMFMHY